MISFSLKDHMLKSKCTIPPVLSNHLSVKYPEAVLFTVEKVYRVDHHVAIFRNGTLGTVLGMFLELITCHGQHREN